MKKFVHGGGGCGGWCGGRRVVFYGYKEQPRADQYLPKSVTQLVRIANTELDSYFPPRANMINLQSLEMIL